MRVSGRALYLLPLAAAGGLPAPLFVAGSTFQVQVANSLPGRPVTLAWAHERLRSER